jgi:hypothetical protein
MPQISVNISNERLRSLTEKSNNNVSGYLSSLIDKDLGVDESSDSAPTTTQHRFKRQPSGEDEDTANFNKESKSKLSDEDAGDDLRTASKKKVIGDAGKTASKK